VVDDREELAHILGLMARECVGELQSDRLLEDRRRENVLLHEEVRKATMEAIRVFTVEYQAPVLLVLDEGFEVGTLKLRNVSFTRRSIKTRERNMIEVKELSMVFGLWFTRHLWRMVGLEMLLGGKVQRGELLEDAVDRGPVARDLIAAD